MTVAVVTVVVMAWHSVFYTYDVSITKESERFEDIQRSQLPEKSSTMFSLYIYLPTARGVIDAYAASDTEGISGDIPCSLS